MNGEPVRWEALAPSNCKLGQSIRSLARNSACLALHDHIAMSPRYLLSAPSVTGTGADAIGKAHESAGEGRGIGMGLGVAHRRNPTMARKERGLEARRDPSADRRSRYPVGTPSARRRMWGRVSRPGGGTEGGPRGVGRRGGPL